MNEYWEIYMKQIDGYPASVSFNVGIVEDDLKDTLMYMGFIKLKINQPNEKGMISEEEAPQLQFIEDSIEAAVLRFKVGNYVGKIITNGEVNFIFYLRHDFEWRDVVEFSFKDVADYGYEFGSKMDSEWEIYNKLLLPNATQWQMIHNHNTCDRMRAQGDTLEEVRAIEHVSFFKTQDDGDTFALKLKNDGFQIKACEPEADQLKLSYYRKDRPFYYDIDDLTLHLIALSEACHGQYDGWECAVMKA